MNSNEMVTTSGNYFEVLPDLQQPDGKKRGWTCTQFVDDDKGGYELWIGKWFATHAEAEEAGKQWREKR